MKSALFWAEHHSSSPSWPPIPPSTLYGNFNNGFFRTFGGNKWGRDGNSERRTARDKYQWPEFILNTIILKSKSKISYCRQAQTLIGNIVNAKTEISILNKAKENLEQKNEELKGQIQSASNENLNLKNKNEQFNKEIEELMENKRQNELLLKGKKMKLKRTIKEFALYKQRITSWTRQL